MIKILSAFLLSLTLLAFPAYAQDQEATTDEIVVEEQTDQSPIKEVGNEDDYDERLELSRKMHEIWPIRVKIESALERLSQQIEAPQRLRFKAAMRQAIKFDALEEASVEAMSEIFTSKELEAMIDFYGSKEGRSVSHKTADYERAMEPLLVKMIDKAILDTKLGTPQ